LFHLLHDQGFRPPFAGHKDNHAGLMTQAQVEVLRALGIGRAMVG
jgi:hypothetical protein